jgi:hypothetical protein
MVIFRVAKPHRTAHYFAEGGAGKVNSNRNNPAEFWRWVVTSVFVSQGLKHCRDTGGLDMVPEPCQGILLDHST